MRNSPFALGAILICSALMGAKVGLSDDQLNELPKNIRSQFQTFLDCGRSLKGVADCSVKFLDDSLMKEQRDKITLWLLRNHGQRELERCNVFQTKVIRAAGYADHPFVCLKHNSGTTRTGMLPEDANDQWGFINYEAKAGGLRVTRVKDK